jgi:hypothetical protein
MFVDVTASDLYGCPEKMIMNGHGNVNETENQLSHFEPILTAPLIELSFIKREASYDKSQLNSLTNLNDYHKGFEIRNPKM